VPAAAGAAALADSASAESRRSFLDAPQHVTRDTQ